MINKNVFLHKIYKGSRGHIIYFEEPGVDVKFVYNKQVTKDQSTHIYYKNTRHTTTNTIIYSIFKSNT